MTAADHTRYVEWDAAYVLGALSPAERKEYESHLDECKPCRAAVAELSALPGLLGRLDAARAVATLDDAAADPPLVPSADLVARIERTDRARRRRRRLGTGIAVTAAAAIATVLALVLPPVVAPDASPAVAAVLSPVDDAVPVEADVALTPAAWGTRIDMRCGYRPPSDGANGGYGSVEYAMWVVGRDGDETALSTWKSSAGSDVAVSAGTSLALAEIARIELRSVAGDQVLLAADF